MAANFAFGAIMGTAYSYGLGKYVLGGSLADIDSVEGAGWTGKICIFNSFVGFFTYQLASLNQ